MPETYLGDFESLFAQYLHRNRIPLVSKTARPLSPRLTPEPEVPDNASDRSKRSDLSALSMVAKDHISIPLTAAVKSFQQTTPPPERKKRLFTCRECNRSFNRKEHLQRHERIHTGARPFACKFPGCGKTFSRCDNRDTHHQTHFK
jgi:uncharacterized Zn-finger protein